jgi:Zn-dependent protease with chaperone function
MATDFYQRQDDARRTTTWLMATFVAAITTVTVGTMAVAWVAVRQGQGYVDQRTGQFREDVAYFASPEETTVPLGAGGITLALISGGTLFKVAQLRGGGHVVAESLNGRRVYPDTTDPVERRLLNVVEEMALASGVPVPPVFMLDDEPGINAFAAGYSPSDAVVAVTRGCAEQLKRDELQGVVAHEFSHILNGDMRINIRMIGLLFGLLLIGLMGRMIVRSMMHSGSSRRSSRNSKDSGNSALYFLAIGAALMVLGYLGTLIGNLIKAAVSRQREYLADASAVQFTRNPDGLAGALKRIGGAVFGSKLQAANAAEASHMYFAKGVFEGFTGLTATHPPLEERIRRLDPAWDGAFPAAPAEPAGIAELGDEAAGLVGGTREGRGARSNVLPVAVVKRAAEQVGDPTERHREYAAALVESLSPLVRQSAREPYGSRAVLLALLTDRKPTVREQQIAKLQELAPADLVELTLKLLPEIDALDVRARLPLVDLSLPALRAMSKPQYDQFLECFKALVAADNRLGLFEWTLYRVLLRHLRPQFEKTAAPKAAYYGFQKLARECSLLLSTLAHADNRRADAADIKAAFAKGAERLPNVAVQLFPPEACGLNELSGALDELSRVAEKQLHHLVAACAAVICADREVTVAEAELLRGVCDMLDCPMPPLLPGGPADVQGDLA